MKYGYYPGCCMHSTAPEYQSSLEAVCGKLGIELQEVAGWICCGTSPAHSTSRLLSLALPLENLRLAEAMELAEVVAPCASCFARLKVARHESNTDPELAEQLSEVLDAPVPTKIEVLHPLEILSNGVDIRAAVERELPALKVVCYYGCLLTRPPDAMQFDDCEYPMSMDRCLRDAGIETLDWARKTDCCGGALVLSGLSVPQSVTGWAELAVGVMLVLLGIWAARASRRLHVHAPHDHGGNAHLHSHAPKQHPHSHVHGDSARRHRHLSTIVGAIHGLAGTAPVVALIPVTLMPTRWGALGYLAVGTYSALAAVAAARAASSAALARTVAVGTAAASLTVGAWWIVRALGDLAG